MKLELAIPDAFRRTDRDGFVTYDSAGLVMLVSPLLPMPEDPLAWTRQQFTGGAIGSSKELRTLDGWPALITEGMVGDETRLVVQYRFVDHGAGVIVRCRDAAVYARLKPILLDLLGHARPDFRDGGILSLAELFDGVLRP